MLYLTCTIISCVDLAHYGVSHAKDWILWIVVQFNLQPPLLVYTNASIAYFRTTYFILSKVYTDEGGIK